MNIIFNIPPIVVNQFQLKSVAWLSLINDKLICGFLPLSLL